MKNCKKAPAQSATPKKPVKKQTTVDPVKELEKAQRKIKKLQGEAKRYLSWFREESNEKDKALKAYKESQYVARLFKDRADEYFTKYTKMLEERIGESTQKLRDQWKEIDYALGKVKPWKHDSKTEDNIRILCINTGVIDYKNFDGTIVPHSGEKAPLEYCETYTTPGAQVNEDGILVYPINEFGGVTMLAQRFAVLQ
jgi:hypothetical protein